MQWSALITFPSNSGFTQLQEANSKLRLYLQTQWPLWPPFSPWTSAVTTHKEQSKLQPSPGLIKATKSALIKKSYLPWRIIGQEDWI